MPLKTKGSLISIKSTEERGSKRHKVYKICMLSPDKKHKLNGDKRKKNEEKKQPLWELSNKRCVSFVTICLWCSFTTEILNLANKLKQRWANSFNYLLRIFFWKVFFRRCVEWGDSHEGIFLLSTIGRQFISENGFKNNLSRYFIYLIIGRNMIYFSHFFVFVGFQLIHWRQGW